MGYIRPIPNTSIASTWQDHKNRKPVPSSEPGTDYRTLNAGGHVVTGVPVFAPQAGVVEWIHDSPSGAGGRTIMVRFNDGHWGALRHLSRVNVTEGQKFAQGHLLARSGASAFGSETGTGGPHLHFSFWPVRRSAPTPGDTPTIDFEAFLASPAGGGETPFPDPKPDPPELTDEELDMCTIRYTYRNEKGYDPEYMIYGREYPNAQGYEVSLKVEDGEAWGLLYGTDAGAPMPTGGVPRDKYRALQTEATRQRALYLADQAREAVVLAKAIAAALPASGGSHDPSPEAVAAIAHASAVATRAAIAADPLG